ncbi:MAG TPA: hypothetical protein VJS92_00415, partial [Candidatus Polarisedimenticolaceae bacterium]|nr:hypothetical protein [Candidatus Polarisedimenticolaceae bacterium]
MLRIRRVLLAATAALVLPGALRADNAEQLRRDLSGFFAGGAEAAPTVLGGLSRHPAARQAILERLAELPAEDLAKLAEGFSAIPAWQAVPEALASALPPESLGALRRHATNAEREVRELEEFRGDVETLDAAARLLGIRGQTLRGADRATLRRVRGALASQPDALRQRLVEALPETVRRHLPELAAHGAFDETERRELAAFRSALERGMAL